ncbi:efflux RND transporter periplasmic adaptor subunit [Tropicimonas sp. IMCC34043]|uniref:efflux RND transporter periplasmic adaptor subunit n=1 Tax=Tropicimonas sp. IMCC34043 TaxID=2248760 RepID=UPI0013004E69|nr:efflux RND transporter periplasmic adaptor subunit [Tropicimonas sp. IMCC34043]
MFRTIPSRLLAFCLLALSTVSLPAAAQQAAAPTPLVTVVPASMQSVGNSLDFTGRVDAVDRVALRARSAGFVQSVNFREGQNVAEGDVLFQIEPDAYEAAVARIEGQIASAEAQKKLADIEFNRQTELVKRQAVSQATAQEAEAQVGNVVGQIQELQASLRQAQLDLSYTKIVAPFAGRVGLTDIAVGAFVSLDSGALVSLFSVDPIYVTVPIAEALLLDYQASLKTEGGDDVAERPSARLILANGEEYPETGTLAVLDAEVQRGTDTILVRASFPNPNGLLRDGQLVTVILANQNQPPELTIPLEALQKDQAGYFVMVVDGDGTVAKRSIAVSRTSGALAIVGSGLAKGDQVVTEGLQRIRDGMKVDAEPAAQAAPIPTEQN